VDTPTLEAYDAASRTYATDWETQPPPLDLYQLLGKYFARGLTADIGCGSGREVAWLLANGYDAVGYDASKGLLEEAQRLHPGARFLEAKLPDLLSVPRATYRNALCETVIMHLAVDEIGRAVSSLMDILITGGTLYVSWRVTDTQSQRDPAGRLYSAFGKESVIAGIGARDHVLLDEEAVSESSGKRIHRLVVQKAEAL
jgi:SAM-dependent methyltransferase